MFLFKASGIGGIYNYAYRINVGERLTNTHLITGDVVQGTYDKYINVMPISEDEKVIFDFSGQKMADANRGIQVYSDFWHFKDLEIRGAGDNGMYVAGSHNIIENCLFYNNKDTGLQLGRAYSTDNYISSWPTCNVIKNCTSFANYDDGTFGENADGFAAKLTVGYGNVFDGCIAFRNSDDGWDLFAKVDSGDIGTVILTNCVSFENGFLPYQHNREDSTADKIIKTYDTLNGDGIGFKLGGSTMRGNVIVDNCATFDNKLHGIGDNSNPGVIQVSNVTAFNNCAGINDDGTISNVRGLDGIQNKSNNIDLARSIASYNSYYGVLSYINNQKNYTTANDSSYNKDAYRGSTAYSIFQTGYNKSELYKGFTSWQDGSSYRTATEDLAFSSGNEMEALTDNMFYDLASINATCDNNDIETLASKIREIHNDFRNEDNSVNLGDHLRVKEDSILATYADGNPVGSVLNKTSDAEYNHYDIAYADSAATYQEGLTSDEVAVESAKSICEPITRIDATYQDFPLPKLLHSCDISWVSDNENVISIEKSEEYSVSYSAFSWARINVPAQDTKVKLTATIKSGKAVTTREFEITVKSRKRTLGDLVSTSTTAIRVNLYGSFIAPRIYATDNSSITVTDLPLSEYDLKYTIKYASDGNAKYYTIAKDVDSVSDYVYTSVPGVYEVTATATLKSDTRYTNNFTYNVYVVDPDCDIDFKGDSTVTLSQEGFVVSGALSNIEGNVAAIYSKTPLTLSNGEALLAQGGENVQYVKINTDSIVAEFEADNRTQVEGDTQYYLYYTVLNANKSNASTAKVYSSTINVENIESEQQFYTLARTGKGPSGTSSNTIIYNLTKDLDFSNFNWAVSTNDKEFIGLFKGNFHKISNITVDESADDKQVKTINVFYKVSGGTVMDVYFDNISLTGNESTAKQVGIIGELQGGYVSNVHATRVSAYGREAIGGVIGQVTGNINYVDQCSLVNPIPELTTDDTKQNAVLIYKTDDGNFTFDQDEFNALNTYRIHAKNKYAAGIIGNVQENNDLVTANVKLVLNVTNCYVSAAIGDGYDGAGNTGLLISRVKNDYQLYEITVKSNVVTGIVLAKGQYNAGIVGDFDNGSGNVNVSYNYADVSFYYSNMYLDAYLSRTVAGGNKYAHKNSNPIVGRAVSNPVGIYVSATNVGTWTEYYSTYIKSNSLAYDLWDEEENEPFNVTQAFLTTMCKLDFDNIWKFDETNKIAILKQIAE